MSWYPQNPGEASPGEGGQQAPAPPPSSPPAASTPQSSAPPPPPPPPQDAAAAPGSYAAPPAQDSSKATVALVLAILSFVVLGLILSVSALIVANSAQKEIDASGGQLGGANRVKTARILAAVNIVLSAVVLVIVAIALAT